MNCLIAGGSGLVGQHLLNFLLSDPKVTSITAIARTNLKYSHSKLQTLISSFDILDSILLPQSNIAFCCLGTTIKIAGSQEAFFRVDHDYILNFARSSQKAGVGTFIVVSAMGADPSSSIFYNKVKGQTELDLIKLNFKKLVIIRPSLLLGERLENRPAEKIAQRLSQVFGKMMIGPLKNIRPIEAVNVALKMKLVGLDENPLNIGIHLIQNSELFINN
jgi:uncharacterized protein YbjT (DUF2867 family)